MATSGKTDFSLNRTDIIQRALRRVSVLAEGHVPPAEMEADAVINLNLLVKEWMNLGYNLWTYTEQYIFPVANQAKYSLPSAKSCYEADYVRTELRVAAVSAATTLEVDSTTGMAAGDVIGVTMDDNLLHWTTIASIVDSDTLTLTAGLTGAAAIDRPVHTYTTVPDNPMRAEQARRLTLANQQIPIDLVTRDIYNQLPDKTTSGVINQVYMDRQRDTKDIFVWPVPADETEVLILTIQRKLENFDAATDNPDFPIEWGNAIIWNLAEQLAHEYTVADKILARVERQALRSLDRALNFFDREDKSLFFSPQMIGK